MTKKLRKSDALYDLGKALANLGEAICELVDEIDAEEEAKDDSGAGGPGGSDSPENSQDEGCGC